jgi:hypothetical protein
LTNSKNPSQTWIWWSILIEADNVNIRLSGLMKDFLIAILLVVLTLLPLGLRAASVIGFDTAFVGAGHHSVKLDGL